VNLGLALVGRRPASKIRKTPAGGYQLRFRRHGEMRTSSEVYAVRAEAERALWQMADDGRADCNYDRRYRAPVRLTAVSGLRWGEVTALRRCDLDLEVGTRTGACCVRGAVNRRDLARGAEVQGTGG
jgi:integrase